jgi:MFS transporter, DHA1 family, inner membrane transport protein
VSGRIDRRQEAAAIALARQSSVPAVEPGARGGELWLLVGLCVAPAVQQLSYFALSPFLSTVAAELGTSIALLGQIPALMTLLAAPVAVVIGPLADRLGYRPLLLAAMAAVVLSSLGTALAQTYTVLLAVGLVGALARATANPIAQAVAGTRFTGDRRRRAIGWIQAGVSGAAIVGIPALTTIEGMLGWRAAFVALALLAGATALLLALALPAERSAGEAPRLGAVVVSLLVVLRDRPTAGLVSASLLRTAGIWLFYTYMGAFFVERYGFTTQQVGWTYTVVGLALFSGAMIAGGRIGGIGPRPFVIATSALMGFALAAVLLLPVGPAAAIGLLILNCVLGSSGSVVGTLLLVGETPGGRATTLTLNQAGLSLGTALGSSLGGLLIALGGYGALGVGVPALGLASAALVWLSRPRG